LLAALLFGAFDGLTAVLPGLFAWIPPELIRMIPFVVTILALLLFSYRALRERQLKKVSQ
jgi:simple sugar transport system permease protein